MHEQPRRTLCKLIKQYGPELHADPRRTEALLLDLCNGYPREIFVLVSAQKRQAPADLLHAPRWMPRQAVTAQLVRRLQENLAFTEEAATWAVETWAIALRIQPAPPDRAWLWFKQHTPTRQSLQPTINFIRTFPDLGEGLFRRFGVKLLYENFTNGSLVKKRAVRWVNWLLRSPVGLAIVVSICAVFAIGSVNRNVSSSQPALSVVEQLAAVYPLPRMAWISDDQLTIRAGPTTSATALGFLLAGQAVTVVEFSADGQWSHISAPTDGWINNTYVLFRPEEAPTVYAVIKVEHAQITTAQLPVYNGPGATFATVGSLVQGQAIELVATSQDGRWKQIITPFRGWISTEFVQVSEACGDKLKGRSVRVSSPSFFFRSLAESADLCNAGCHLAL